MCAFIFAHKARSQQLSPFFVRDVRFSWQSSTTREHRLRRRLEPEVQEGHFTSKIRMKQRLKSSHCARNGNRREERTAGKPETRLLKRRSGVTCPDRKIQNAPMHVNYYLQEVTNESGTFKTEPTAQIQMFFFFFLFLLFFLQRNRPSLPQSSFLLCEV